MAITLRGITWKNPRGYAPLVAAASLWTIRRPEVRIHWDQLPWYEFEEKVLGSLAAGDGAYDLIMFDHPWTGKMARENWLVPWDTLLSPRDLAALRERVVAPSLESYEWNNHLWALPLDAACHSGVYRNDLVDGTSLPRTWEEMVSWAERHHAPPHRYGLVLSVEGVLGSCLFLSMMAGLGHPPYQDEDDPVCNRDAAAYVLAILRDLLKFVPPGSTHWGPWDIYEHLCAKDDVGYSPSIFAYVNYFGKEPRRKNLRLSRVPDFSGSRAGRPILGGVGLGIARTCPHIDQARAAGEFLMNDKIQSDVFPAHVGQPAARTAWQDPALNRQCGDFYFDLAKNMATAYTRPRYPSFHRLELEIGRTLQGWWDGERKLEETLEGLRAR